LEKQILDIYADDENHGIPRLAELDLIGKKVAGGADLLIVVSSPIGSDEFGRC
jgi:hypothetical protein